MKSDNCERAGASVGAWVSDRIRTAGWGLDPKLGGLIMDIVNEECEKMATELAAARLEAESLHLENTQLKVHIKIVQDALDDAANKFEQMVVVLTQVKKSTVH